MVRTMLLGSGIKGSHNKVNLKFLSGCWGIAKSLPNKNLRFACERMESNIFFLRKGDPNQFEREESTKYMSIQHLLIDSIFLHLARFEDSKVEGFWVIGEPPGTKVRSSMIFQTYIFRLSDPQVCVKVLLRPRN